MWCAGRTPIGGSKSEGTREACRVLAENVAELQLSPVARGAPEKLQAFG